MNEHKSYLKRESDRNQNISKANDIKKKRNIKHCSLSDNNKGLKKEASNKNKKTNKAKKSSLDDNVSINNKKHDNVHVNFRDGKNTSRETKEKSPIKSARRVKSIKRDGDIKHISKKDNIKDYRQNINSEGINDKAELKKKREIIRKCETGKVKSKNNIRRADINNMKPSENKEKTEPKSQNNKPDIKTRELKSKLNGLGHKGKHYIKKTEHIIKNEKYNKMIKAGLAAVLVILIAVFGFNKYNNEKRLGSYEDTKIKQTIYINNEEFETKNPFKVRNKVIYAPIEEIVEGLGKQISYDKGITGTIKIHYHGEEYKAKPGSNEVYSVSTDETSNIKGCIEIIDGKLYAPMEFIKEVMPINIMKSDDNEVFIDVFNDQFDYSWTKDNIYIAHAMGGIGGLDYTNSLEAFEKNYEKGYKVFEADIAMTKDDEPVLLHAWSKKSTKQLGLPSAWEGKAATYNDFMSQKINGMYTPLSFEDLCNLMKEHDDMMVVLDLKTDVSDAKVVYSKLIEVARSVGDPTVLDRLIPQIYEEEMCDIVMDVYDFKSMIYSLYKQPYLDADSVVDFAYKKGIRVVVIDRRKFDLNFINEINKRGLMIYTNTYNMPDAVSRLKRRGIHGFFSDFINPVTEKNPYIEDKEEQKESEN